MPVLTCPACGLSGESAGTEECFEDRGRHELMQVRKCRRCGAGLFVRYTLLPTETVAEVIPAEAWTEIERQWERSTARPSDGRSRRPA